jgi:hypothetical protein
VLSSCSARADWRRAPYGTPTLPLQATGIGAHERRLSGLFQGLPTSNEVQFALVIARMIDTVKGNPEVMRQTVYDLARYKLHEQFTDANAKDIKRTQQALEIAIRGVEEFSRQQLEIPPPAPPPQIADGTAPRQLLTPEQDPSHQPRPLPVLDRIPIASGLAIPRFLRSAAAWRPNAKAGRLSAPIMRTIAVLLLVGAALVPVQQRERLTSLVQDLTKYNRQVAAKQPAPAVAVAAPASKPVPTPNPLRPTDYGIYAIGNDQLADLQLLPGRPPDIRVAVSAALKTPSHTILPNGHPKFIVFRRDAATHTPDRAEVRIVAKVAREFSAEAAGKKPDDSDGTWVIRNVSFPFRSSPIPDNPEMYELHSEDPALELTPGRYALIVKSQAYDFSVEGVPVDPRQCIERVLATNGTFYVDCKKL